MNKMRSTPSRRWLIKKGNLTWDQMYSTEKYGQGLKEPNSYVKNTNPNNHILADIRCECGDIMTLVSENHTVDQNGVINPSVHHQRCGFHEWAQFKNWS